MKIRRCGYKVIIYIRCYFNFQRQRTFYLLTKNGKSLSNFTLTYITKKANPNGDIMSISVQLDSFLRGKKGF